MSAIEDSLREQLKLHIQAFRMGEELNDCAFRGSEDLVLRAGEFYPRTRRKLPTSPVPKACFAQAYRFATHRRSKWIYVEGYAINEKVPMAVPHAWITPRSNPGEAYDLAWRPEVGATAYLGVAFDPGYVRRIHRSSGSQFFSVLDAWWIDYPLVTGETKLADVVWKKRQENDN
jgi:hypothetical protein